MLPEARRRAILADLKRAGSATIAELARRYHVSAMTIRRDLKALASRGLLSLTHGGAVYNHDLQHDINAQALASPDGSPAQLAIARYAAARLVNDGDTLFLDAAELSGLMAACLGERAALTIVSSDLRALERLRRRAGWQVIGTGGQLRPESSAFVGPLAERFFDAFFAPKAFIGGCGFTLEAGLTSADLPEAGVKRAMIASAKRRIALIESSKLGATAMAQVLAIAEIDAMISDAGVSAAMRRDIQAAGIELHIAEL